MDTCLAGVLRVSAGGLLINNPDDYVTHTSRRLGYAKCTLDIFTVFHYQWGTRTSCQDMEVLMAQATKAFSVVEATIDEIHAAYKSHQLTCQQLVQMYLDRIEAYDKKGPAINAIITVNPDALNEAAQLDAAFKASGSKGPLHGIPVILKDQADVKGMPTTLGSVLFKGYFPDRDSFVAERLKKAHAPACSGP